MRLTRRQANPLMRQSAGRMRSGQYLFGVCALAVILETAGKAARVVLEGTGLGAYPALPLLA